MRRRFAILAAAVTLALPGVVLGACDGSAPDSTPSPTRSTAAPAATPTTRAALPDGVLDVRSFGARGDGTADDSAAVQRAIDQAAQTGAAAFVPAGTYRCPTPIELPAGVTLRGEGAQSWLKGKLLFDSGDTVEGLKIGDVGRCAVTTHAADGDRDGVPRLPLPRRWRRSG